MAPTWPEEVDVFSVPHSRMKELVQGYLDQMTATNFSNVIHLTTLLENLCNAFQEFKIHEQIENKYILCRLRQKLRSLSIRNSAVCNCHSDNRLSEMLELVKDGFQWMWRPQAERLHYGFKLRRALEEFTGSFIPHMEEEEAIFQPMLIEYFSYDELKAIKAEVIKQHLRKASDNYQEEKFVEDTRSRKFLSTYLLGFCEVSSEEEESADSKPSLDILPDEILLNILSYCTPIDLTRCSQVSQRLNTLSLDGSLWTQLYPVHWAQGRWSNRKEVEESDMETSADVFETYIVIDEDADVDETPGSELSSGGDDTIQQVKKEVKVLLAIVKYLLPRVGHFIKKCSLAYSRGLSNGIVKKILKFCPNLEYLNLKQTRVTDAAFKVLGEGKYGSKLRYLDLTGCKNITDFTLQKLAEALQYSSPSASNVSSVIPKDSKDFTQMQIDPICDIEDFERTRKSASATNTDSRPNSRQSKRGICNQLKGDNSPHQTEICYDLIVSDTEMKTEKSLTVQSSDSVDKVETSSSTTRPGLEYLNLSGCQNITTDGIRYLVELGSLPNLRYLNLSGCMDVSGEKIYELVSICPVLDHSQLYYCDNLTDDPFPETASGCCNVDCGSRFCCRN
ncbi:hypothetical protein LOTGIDRAFT_116755 [Lottia gigantea]|uniref:F-box domain-containing protein n=1 Tax=Lottia gigantea TaxID=225164 RepID=V4C2E6_LOTGI|nr:hypothetical protein LOTGIDRAFT_116755 [Lottia gigantea]ESO95679.1 hypothetical protein LOTGIDRAFT_116755 [Lottia gigantea]